MENIESVLSMAKRSDRYRNFTFLDNPVLFDQLFKGKNYSIVQIHDMTPVGESDIVGFSGDCRWKNGTLTSLDGDSYTEKMPVWAYSEFETNETKCLDILVEEW